MIDETAAPGSGTPRTKNIQWSDQVCSPFAHMPCKLAESRVVAESKSLSVARSKFIAEPARLQETNFLHDSPVTEFKTSKV